MIAMLRLPRTFVPLVMLIAALCVLSGCAEPGSAGCEHDTDCEGSEVCRDGACTHPCAGVQCEPGEVCVDGQCVACEPDCAGRACGPDPVCGTSCGECDSGEVCTIEGVCTGCLPDCAGRACGPDPVCNVLCGACDPGDVCNPQGQCEACTPDCAGLECGPDPACGSSCGTCAQGQECEDGACVCLPHASQACHQDDVWWFDSCGQPEERIAVCENGCDAGQCLDCTPDCAGRACGPDPECGTSCGTCTPPDTCDAAGLCECTPDCSGRECGDDPQCGTSCGACTSPETCNQQGQCEPPAIESYDVVVVGAGTGGIGAAIQAARMGMDVALLEETDWVGGQATAAGVSNMDDSRYAREWESGIYAEFIVRIVGHYAAMGKTTDTCYWASSHEHCFEPSVGREILEEMLDEADALADGNLDLHLRTKVVEVLREGDLVTGVLTADGDLLESRILIDATECGDILPLAGARYRVGNSTSDAINLNACMQDITYTTIMRKYPNAVPPELVFDENEKPPGYDDEEPVIAQVVAANGSNWWTNPRDYPVDFVSHNAYRGMPDSTNPSDYNSETWHNATHITRTGVNWTNDYPGYRHNATLPVRYLEDRDYRFQENCKAKLRTLHFLYYVQHELGQPQWSVANDEGFDSAYNTEENVCPNIPETFRAFENHLSVIPYVRESRRIVGLHTLSAPEIRRVGNPPVAVTAFETSLAVGGYFTDLHNCEEDSDLEAAFETSQDSHRSGRFQIPFASFIPAELDGFLPAEKNLSMTRLVNGASRLQPITMLTGQAVGTLAALAIQDDIQPRAVPPIRVQDVLVSDGVALSLYRYSDVQRDDPFWADVQIASTRGVLMGYGGFDATFGRNDPLTRGQMAVVLVRLLDLPVDPPAQASFQDVPASHSFFGQIEAIKAAGITSGCSSNPPRFCPDDPTTRAQFATFLARGLDLDTDNVPQTPFFEDVTAGHNMFGAVQAVADAGLMRGCSSSPSRFCPDDPALRVQAAIVTRAVLLHLD